LYVVTTKQAHRLINDDKMYFNISSTNYTVLNIIDHQTFTISNLVRIDITNANLVKFDTYNIKTEFLYLYSQEMYTNNKTCSGSGGDGTNFFNNNGPTFNETKIATYKPYVQIISDTFVYQINAHPVDVTINDENYTIYTKIASRRNIGYTFSKKIGASGQGSTSIDNIPFNDDIKNTMLVNIKEEWIIENHTEVVHGHHQHINNYQVCGYISEAAGFNISSSRLATNIDGTDKSYNITFDSTYSNTTFKPLITNPVIQEEQYRYNHEIHIPFYGYEDTTYIPIGRGVPDANGILDAPYGLRGRLRIRFTNKQFCGLYVHHCHLLDDQDMGMMKIIEIVGIDASQNYYNPLGHVSRLPPRGIKTDYYNNIWREQPN